MVLGEEEALMKISGIRSSARQRDLRQELIRSSSDAATDDEKGDVSPEHGSSLARGWGKEDVAHTTGDFVVNSLICAIISLP